MRAEAERRVRTGMYVRSKAINKLEETRPFQNIINNTGKL